ncbi:MAG: hypothetical protein ACRC6K_00765 [Fusobacteriaceae bacterium]
MEVRGNEVEENEKVLTVKDWLKIQLIMMIPILNIIMWIKWLVSDKTNKNLKNFLISSLVMLLIWATLVVVLWSTIIAIMMGTEIF